MFKLLVDSMNKNVISKLNKQKILLLKQKFMSHQSFESLSSFFSKILIFCPRLLLPFDLDFFCFFSQLIILINRMRNPLSRDMNIIMHKRSLLSKSNDEHDSKYEMILQGNKNDISNSNIDNNDNENNDNDNDNNNSYNNFVMNDMHVNKDTLHYLDNDGKFDEVIYFNIIPTTNDSHNFNKNNNADDDDGDDAIHIPNDRRKLTMTDGIAIIVGIIIGSGIFSSPG